MSTRVRYKKIGRTGKNCFTGEMRELIDKEHYICRTYNHPGKNSCTSHKIRACNLYNLSLCVHKVRGILTEQYFLHMAEKAKQKQTDNKAQIQIITDELRSAIDANSNVRCFIRKIREYVSITERNKIILEQLNDKIFISVVKIIGGERVLKVRIAYEFVSEIVS